MAWIPPPLASLNISSNCTLVARFILSWYADGPEFFTLVEYLRHALPSEGREHLTSGQLVDWYASLPRDGEFERLFVVEPRDFCKETICETFPWTGSPDVFGVEVS